jgi:hypothetical protein
MSTPSRPVAQLVHSTTGRVRFRFDEKRGDASFFDSLSSSLARLGSVIETRVSSHTGSVLVLHTGDLQQLVTAAQKRGLFEVGPPPPPTASARRLRDAIDTLEDRVAKSTGETLSVGKLLFLGLLGAGILQSKQGHLLPAGMTLFKHAIEVMHWVADREPTNSQHRAQSVSHS